jgi:hypothetical protein
MDGSWRKIAIARFDLKKGEQTAQAYEDACYQHSTRANEFG